MPKRMITLFAAMLFFFVCIIGKIYDTSQQWFAQTAQQQATRTVTVFRTRGTLYDRQMQPLTNAEKEWRLCALALPETMALLQEQLSEQQIEGAKLRWEQGYPAVIDHTQPLISAQGLLQFCVPIRYQYPMVAQHLIGYVGNDGVGATGLEKIFEQTLSQMSGSIEVTYAIDANGRVLQGVAPKIVNTSDRSVGGVALTIDATMQKAIEQICQNYLPKGAVVVMQPDTGHILSMVSCPSYRADDITSVLQNQDSPLVNRALCNYNLGSVFKIVSVAAALEAGISQEQTFVCTGSIPVGSRKIRCHYRLGHGQQDMQQGFLHSCNPYFIQLMQKTGSNAFSYMAYQLGFDRALTLAPGYQTACAVLPSEAEWSLPSVLADLSFGQGSLMATPIHIAQLISAVVNDGQMIRPTVFLGEVDSLGNLKQQTVAAPQQVFSAQTAQQLRQMMIATVEEGTGREGCPDSGGAGAKTGTAETGWTAADGSTMVQSWYAGFYPAQNPKFAVVVLSEDAGTTKQNAAPVFREICNHLMYFLEQ